MAVWRRYHAVQAVGGKAYCTRTRARIRGDFLGDAALLRPPGEEQRNHTTRGTPHKSIFAQVSKPPKPVIPNAVLGARNPSRILPSCLPEQGRRDLRFSSGVGASDPTFKQCYKSALTAEEAESARNSVAPSPQQLRRKKQDQNPHNNPVNGKRSKPALPHPRHKPRHAAIRHDERHYKPNRQHDPSVRINA